MNDRAKLDETLATLFGDACDGILTDAQLVELAAKLDQDEQAIDDYLEFCLLHVELRRDGHTRHCFQ